MPATDEEKATIRTREIQVAEINHSLKFFRKVGWTLIGCALAVVASALTVADRAGQVEHAVGTLTDRVAKVEHAVGTLDGRLARVETDVAGHRRDMTEFQTDVKGQLDRIEKAVAQNPPGRRP